VIEMTVNLTDRMKAWIEAMGCHLCVATPEGVPFVVLGRYAKATASDEVAFALAQDEAKVIAPVLSENSRVAFGVSRQGGIRAAYQFKGTGELLRSGSVFDTVAAQAKEEKGIDAESVLLVRLTELYCTKPGYEAGQRLDGMTPEELDAWERQRWKDVPRKRD
jgi:predicted pyridoxine 5'-phosphate oxidase superfamily flavin-nucleotide-binding protein